MLYQQIAMGKATAPSGSSSSAASSGSGTPTATATSSGASSADRLHLRGWSAVLAAAVVAVGAMI